jgi:hypothetical protein
MEENYQNEVQYSDIHKNTGVCIIMMVHHRKIFPTIDGKVKIMDSGDWRRQIEILVIELLENIH